MKSTHDLLTPMPTRQCMSVRLTPIALACLATLAPGAAVHAQQADAGQTVVVTGIRRAVESSIATKRNSESIVEAISSEDIGKLPDVSIAESLARLPGLAAQRVAGRAQVIAIRGLSPDFAGTLLNGRAQVTTGDNRSVEYDQFPSELINAATVYKTPDAALMGQGLSGTIDLKTIRPLDLRGRAVTLNARMEHNSNGALNANTSGNGNRFSASYIDQFADNTVGVAVGFAHLDSPAQQLHYKAWGFSQFPSTCRVDWGCGQPSGGPAGSTYLNGYEAEAISSSQKRDGLMAVLEYKPNKDVHSTVDLYYSKFKKNETMRGLMGGLGENWNGVPGAAYTNVGTTPVGNSSLVTSANIANTVMVVRNDLNTRDDELKSAGWNTEFKLGTGWKGIVDLSYSRADREENVIESYAGPYAGSAKATGSFAVTVPTGPGFPTLVPGLNYADASTIKLSDPAVWGHDALWKKPKMSDEIKALRLEARHDLAGAFTSVDFGINYATRQKDREMNEQTANLKGGRAPVVVSSDLLQPPTSLGFAGIPGVLSYDVMGALNKYYDVAPTALDQTINRNYQVSEKVSTAFAKVGLDTSLGSVPVRGNMGFQFIHTDQSSHGYMQVGKDANNNPVFADTTRGTTYDDVLPSLNLNFELGNDQIARMGIAKTLARGRMDDMKAGASASVSPTTHLWSGSGGNPLLQPWRATSFDLSFEKYFGKRSYVAAAAFYKKLDSYIYVKTIDDYDFTGFPNPNGLQVDKVTGKYSTPANGEGGNLKGIELSASLDAGMFSKAAEGFGVIASASYTDSTIHPNGPGTSDRLPGLSRVVANLTAYYESGGFSARISERYRSSFRGEINVLHNAREFTEILPDKQVDFQVSYEFGGGAYKGLQVLLQVNNLTNSAYATRQGTGFGDVVAPLEYNKYGRQFLLGLNYRL